MEHEMVDETKPELPASPYSAERTVLASYPSNWCVKGPGVYIDGINMSRALTVKAALDSAYYNGFSIGLLS